MTLIIHAASLLLLVAAVLLFIIEHMRPELTRGGGFGVSNNES